MMIFTDSQVRKVKLAKECGIKSYHIDRTYMHGDGNGNSLRRNCEVKN
jgi:tetrahydromethanopterin S-methyltransferase subunit H